MDSLFDSDELEASELSVYQLGSWWEIKHTAADLEHKYTSVGQVIRHATFDNQWLVDYQRGQEGRIAPVDEHVIEPELHLWTGRHWQQPARIRLSLITKTRQLDVGDIELRKREFQKWVDTWVWTEDVWHNMGPDRWDLDPVVWTPTFTPGRVCTHDKPEWRWSRTMLHGASCDYCHTPLDDIKLPGIGEDRCLWWSYHGSMGRGRPPTSHPDDCTFCHSD